MIVLLIYEYMIVVEANVVQKNTSANKVRFVGKDKPIAERLDRTHFGFDQDYYERMPLLVNAMQEVNYVDQPGKASISRSRKRPYSRNVFKPPTTTAENRFIRRTSPRPFIFEYKSPYPMPFSKTQSTPKNWVEHYRNAQRLKNLHDVIKYLERTLNAKFGDVYLPTRAQIAFSGIYVPPAQNLNKNSYLPIEDNRPQESHNYNVVKYNHQSDPLYTFRPDSPGDINLLVDGYRFAPSAFATQKKQKNNAVKHVFIPVTERKRLQNCEGMDCPSHFSFAKKAESDTSQTEKNPLYDNEPKFLDVQLNVFSSQKTPPENTLNRSNINKIYITSPRPLFHFRRKSTVPFRRSMFTYKQPNVFVEKRKNITITASKTGENKTIIFKRLVPLSIFTTTGNTEKKFVQPERNEIIEETASSITQNHITTDNMLDSPILNYSNVENYHIGSSGIIPIELRTTTPISPITLPDMFATEYSSERASTNPPEIIKFSPEDAKIPDHYLNIRKSDISEVTESKTNIWDYSDIIEKNIDTVESKTLIIKLKNIIETTTTENVPEEIEKIDENEDDIKTTTTGTYVPQINGHHRNVHYKSLTSLLRENSEKYRKKRIENSVSTRTIPNNTYVPLYVEINRNRSSYID